MGSFGECFNFCSLENHCATGRKRDGCVKKMDRHEGKWQKSFVSP